MDDPRLKGDETYPKCAYCKKPIRDNDDSTGLSFGDGEETKFHDKCFGPAMKEIPRRLTARDAK